jgi:Predicted Zn-dependent protease (DUF2268)
VVRLDVGHGRFAVFVHPDALSTAFSVGVDLMKLVIECLTHIDRLLPAAPTRVYIDTGSSVIPEVGTTGCTSADGAVAVTVDPRSRVGYAQTLRGWLPRSVAHELHHSARILSGSGYGRTLLDQFVSEGMADVFAAQAFPGPPSPWNTALNRQQEHDLWIRAKPRLNRRRFHRGWMLGSTEIPRWTGYTIGFHIVQSYLAHHPNTAAADLIRVDGKFILTSSGYDP